MDKTTVIARLTAMEPELRALGVEDLTLFGSHARGEARSGSDVDVAIRLSDELRGLDRIEQLDRIADLMAGWLGVGVDVVEQPVRKPRLRDAIARDGIRVV